MFQKNDPTEYITIIFQVSAEILHSGKITLLLGCDKFCDLCSRGRCVRAALWSTCKSQSCSQLTLGDRTRARGSSISERSWPGTRCATGGSRARGLVSEREK